MNVLGIDFGTSNTVAVLASPDRPPRLLLIDGVGALPSCIYVEDDDSLTVGRDAERKARLAPERFEANPKRRIDDGEILLGVRVVPVVDAIAAVLRRVADEARRQLNGRSPDQVQLTHPAQWGSARQNVLLAAARAAGLGPSIQLIPEPVAAATHFASLPGKSLGQGGCLAVYDLGGGTFDCAVVGMGPSGYTVLAEGGLADVGGVDFDQAVVDHLGRTISSAAPARWQAIARPRTAADRRAARTLREDVRAAKETLSRYAQTDLPLPEPFEDTLLTRKEFDGLIRPVIARTVDVLADTIGRAGLSPDRLAGVYLVGGSSRIPLIATMITERLGIVPVTLDQPETSVAMGAALAPAQSRPQSRTEHVGPPSRPIGPPSGGQAPVGRPGPPPVGPPSGPGRPLTGPSGPQPILSQPATDVDQVARRRKRLQVILVVVLALVVALATLTTLVLVNRKSSAGGDNPLSTPNTTTSGPTSPETTTSNTTSTSNTTTTTTTSPADPAACVSDPDDRGVTSCMKTFIGDFDQLKCTQNLSDLGADSSTDQQSVKQFEAFTTSWSACVDESGGHVLLVFQTTNTSSRDLIWDAMQQSLGTDSEGGNWRASQDSGQYRVGLVDAETALVWESKDRPLFGYLLSTNTATDSSGLVDYWKGKVGVTVS